jgi:hypothetical protein
MRRDGAVVDAWAVQLPENKGTDKVLGDTLHTTIEAAKESAEYEAKRESDRKQWERKDQEEAAKREAAKEANRGKSVAQRAADFSLNQPNKLPPSAGLGTGTRRDAMDKAVEQGRAIRAETVEDTAAKNRDKKAVEAVSKAGYLLGLSNENIPVVKAGLEARARLKADKYPKIEYRVYGGRLAEGPFHTITKIEYDYAVQRQAEQFAAEQDRPAPAPMAAATHKDPGEPAEPAAATAPRTAAEWAEEMARLRKTKPRPLDKLYGAKGPTPEQVTAHAEQERAWNAAYRKAGAEQKKALERDNAEFRAKAAAPAPEAACATGSGSPGAGCRARQPSPPPLKRRPTLTRKPRN